jgi:hypothetical protein
MTTIVQRPLVTFSILSEVYVYQEQKRQEQQRQEQQRQLQQQTQQQEEVKKKKITIKPKATQPAPAPASQHLAPQPPQQKQEQQDRPRKKITFVKRIFKYSDIAPPATICFIPKNDIYCTPPPSCCRFFIENKHCFLRQRDNACICPTSKIVIGFWNEKVGNECKLLPVEDETTYEEAITTATMNNTFPDEAPLPEAPSPKPNASKPSTSSSPPIPKPKYVSDAERARTASEPVALLRAKLAKQYGMMAKKN